MARQKTYFEVLAFLAVLALAAAVRLYRIDAIPPGLWFDEAANGTDALRVLEGDRPIFFEGNNGREPFFIYLVALLFKLLGPSATTIRLGGVAVGLATVVVAFFLGRAVLGRWGGLLTSLALAVSYWHLSLSRLGLRAVSLPLLESLAVLFLWKGLQTRRILWFAASGTALGACLYTYLASRAFPIWLGTFLVLVAAVPSFRPGFGLRKYLICAGILLVAAAVTFAPIGCYFWSHPDQFMARAAAVAAMQGTDSVAQSGLQGRQVLKESILPTLGMFFVAGDANARHNLPGRPVFDPAQAMAFVIGMLMLARRWKDRLSVLLLMWLVMTLLPGALSSEAPHFLRTVGVIPAVFVVQVIGLRGASAGLCQLIGRRNLPARSRAVAALAAALLVLSGIPAVYDYFERWAPSAAVYYAFESDLQDAARLASEAPPDAPVLVSSGRNYAGIPTPLNFYRVLPARARVFNGLRSVLVPATSQPWVYYSIPCSAAPNKDASAGGTLRFLPDAEIVAVAGGPEGTIAARLYRVPAAKLQDLAPAYRLNAVAGDRLAVVGYDLDRRVPPGGATGLVVYLRALRQFQLPGLWQMYAHVTNFDRTKELAADYNNSIFQGQLEPGDLLISWFQLALPTTLSPGTYPVVFGIFERASETHLEMVDADGREVGSSIPLLPVRLVGRQEQVLPQHLLATRFADGVRLLGYDLAVDAPMGQAILTLYWSADNPPSHDYTVFAHLVDREGRIVSQQDNQPQSGQLPTTLWDRGDQVRDEYRLPLHGSVVQGFRLEVGMYRSDTNARLALIDADGKQVGDHLTIQLEVSH